ncbi:hypothetical protein TBS_17870 [Thermobispora bispora]
MEGDTKRFPVMCIITRPATLIAVPASSTASSRGSRVEPLLDLGLLAEDGADRLHALPEAAEEVGEVDAEVDGAGDLRQLSVRGGGPGGDDDQVRAERVDLLVVRLEQRADLGVLVARVLGEVVREVLHRGHPGHLDAELVEGGEHAHVEHDHLLRVLGHARAALSVGDGHLLRGLLRGRGGVPRTGALTAARGEDQQCWHQHQCEQTAY